MKQIKTPNLTCVYPKYDGEHCHLAVSNLTGAVAIIDDDGANVLNKLREHQSLLGFSKEEAEFIKTFYERGFIIDANDDEYKLLERKIKEAREWPGLEVNPIITYLCNLACTYCYVPHNSVTPSFIDGKLVDRIIEYVISRVERENLLYVNLSLYGGEPLLKWKICEELTTKLSDRLEDFKVSSRVGLYTNGILITEEIINFLTSVNTHFVQITLDGPKEIHDQRRVFKSGHRTFDMIMNKIKLVAEKLQCNIRVNVDRQNISKLPVLMKVLLENELNMKNITIDLGRTCAVSHARRYKDKVIPIESYAKKIIQCYFEFEKAGFNVATSSYVVPVIRRPRYIPCISHSTRQIFVDPSGNLYTCTGVIGDKKFSVGNIWKNPVFDERIYQWINFSPLSVKKCRRCKHIAFCGGGCAAEAIAKYGSFEKNRVCGPAEYLFVGGAILPSEWYKRFLEIRKRKEITGSRYASEKEKRRAFGIDLF